MKNIIVVAIVIFGLLSFFLYNSGYFNDHYKIPNFEMERLQSILEDAIQVDDLETIIPTVQSYQHIPDTKTSIIIFTPQESFCKSCSGIAFFDKTIRDYYHFSGSSISNYPITDRHKKINGQKYLILLMDNRKANVHSFQVKYLGKSKTFYPGQDFFVGLMKVEKLYDKASYSFYNQENKNITDNVASLFPSDVNNSISE
ncbi:hypothetical protein [Fredinandcohnia quinoae]|uniref:Uncharacterized protein n=1 Tax=Fredinandcohnia quinoae TaxID=2918902 RepID=A0AAW5E448_9BACI|nr:hypothetical protein [Fredinandcohnia sp. SECRCQ15]MCH1624852.1 hypothetical protein [Fredinandcohnia sp. SECRCQ15]